MIIEGIVLLFCILAIPVALATFKYMYAEPEGIDIWSGQWWKYYWIWMLRVSMGYLLPLFVGLIALGWGGLGASWLSLGVVIIAMTLDMYVTVKLQRMWRERWTRRS